MYIITKKELVDIVSCPIMKISHNLTLFHKVRLSTADKNGNRDYYHKEYSYNSKYRDVKKVSTVKLSHSSLLVIEFRDKEISLQDSMILNITNRDYIYKQLAELKKLLKKDDIIVKIKDDYKINPNYNTSIVFEAYDGKKIGIRLNLITDTDDGFPDIVIQLCLNMRDGLYNNIYEDRFKTMLKFIKKFDFYTTGLLMITYLHSSDIDKTEYEFSTVTNIEYDKEVSPSFNVPIQTNMDKLKTERKSIEKVKW